MVETDALIKALDSGALGGAGLDVLEEEDCIKEETQVLRKDFRDVDLRIILENHLLMERNNVVITPHNAFNSIEGVQRILDTTAKNIKDYIAGEPKNLVLIKSKE